MTLAPDGRSFCASLHGGSIKVSDAANGKEMRLLGDPKLSGSHLTMSPDSRWLAGIANFVYVRDADTGAEVRRLPRPRGYWSSRRNL